MAKPGRNDPCPCGSGKKFKRCCGAASASSDLPPELVETQRIHELDRRTVEDISVWSAQVLGRDVLAEALAVYRADEADETLELEQGLMWSWLIYSYHDEELEPLAQVYLEAHSVLDEPVRALIIAQIETPPSVFQVESVVPGRSIELIDRLSLTRHHVLEAMASRSLVPHDLVLARVLDLPDFSLLMGLHPRALPPGPGESFVERARKRMKARKGQAVTAARRFDADLQMELLYDWREAWGAWHARPLPRIANSDGHPMHFTRDRFTLESLDRTRVLSGLLKLEGAEAGDDEGSVSQVVFLRAEKKGASALGRSLVGRAELSLNTLLIETDSIERSDQLRARVQQALGSLIRFRVREHEDPMAALSRPEAKLGSKKSVDLEVPPEFVAIARQMRAEYMKQWIDLDVPALGGRTPRAASKTKKGREQLELLLREMENQEGRMPEAERVDFRSIRAELGLS